MLSASAHSSHVYRSGINLYFTFAARPDDPASLRPTYLECWRRVMEAVIACGGGIAHHHGIGRVRRAFLRDELGPGGLTVLRALKAALDPVGFMNPGALIPE
jgi:alkyldihydroxyacetonephosphate synthase